MRQTVDQQELTPSIRHFSSWKIFTSALILVVIVSSIGVGSHHLRRSMAELAGQRSRAAPVRSKISDPAPRIPPGCMGKGMTYLIKAILHNNLAGLGPDRGEEDMQFLVSQERHGADTQDIKVSVRAMSAYTPHSASWNGMQGDFASINQMPGQDVKLRFQFRDVANTPLWLDSFDLLLCDLDGGSTSTEFARAFGEHKAYWAHGTKLQLKSHGDYVEYNLKYPYRDAPVQKEDLGVDNPVYAGDLTKKQQQNCVSLHYGSVDHIDLVLGSTSYPFGWGGVRSFFFAFTGLDHCGSKLLRASSSTTSATLTTSTVTRTSLTSTSFTTSATSSTSGSSQTVSTKTITTYTTSTATTVTATTTTEVAGLPIFASPGYVSLQPVNNILRFLAMWAYVAVLLSSASGLVMYWLCMRQAG